jgi:hypothetical protein
MGGWKMLGESEFAWGIIGGCQKALLELRRGGPP